MSSAQYWHTAASCNIALYCNSNMKALECCLQSTHRVWRVSRLLDGGGGWCGCIQTETFGNTEVVSSPSDAELQEKFTCKQGSDRYMYVSVQGIQLQHDEVKAVAVVHGAACLVWQQAFC